MFKKNYYPKISVVMNCHNGEKYLKQSIKSVLKQSYKNLELIFYDNKSNDKSVSIAKSYRVCKLLISFFYMLFQEALSPKMFYRH